jgi:hypothetical protein
MKKVLMTICGAAMLGVATLAQAQDQDSASTNFNNQPIEQNEAPPAQDQPTLDQPTQEQPTLDQPTQEPPVQDQPTLDQPTQDQPVQDQPTQDQPTQEPPVQDQPALDQPTQDQPTQEPPVQDQSRESEQPTEDQTDQSMERPSEITPVEDKVGPNGEAIFQENGKYYYMNEAGEKKKIKKSELQDKTQ